MEFWKNIDIKKILDEIPYYKEFLTVDELDASSKELAKQYDNVDILELGKSRAGHSIYCLKIGQGKKNVLYFGFPHPNEPIGSLTVEFLSRYLAENPEFTENTGYTWYLIKAMDIDGAKLNEGWFKGEFDPVKHARNYYRPPFHEQIEWSFPIEYKLLKFDSPTPATQALMKLLESTKPYFLYSLHNAGFCGIYFYVSHDIKEMCMEFQDLVKNEDLPLHEGEPEMEFGNKLYSGIYERMGIRQGYDYYEKQGVDLNSYAKIGAGSYDYLQDIAGTDNFFLICEMPYVYDRALGNSNESEFNRRELILEDVKERKKFYSQMKKIFKQIRPFCNKESRLYSTVSTNMDFYKTQLNIQVGIAKSSPDYDRKATVAEAFDSIHASKYYAYRTFSQVGRLCEEAYRLHPENQELKNFQNQVEEEIALKIKNLTSKINLEMIPIRKLVRVQVGSGLIALKHLSI